MDRKEQSAAGIRKLRLGYVVDASGKPVSDAVVSILSGTVATPEIGRRSGKDGEFQLALPPGTFQVQATALDGRQGSISINGEEENTVVITVAAPPRGLK